MTARVLHRGCAFPFANVYFCFPFPVWFHVSIKEILINHKSLTPSLHLIFPLSHTQTRYSVKDFKVTYIQPLSFPSHSQGRGVVVGGVLSKLLQFFP